MSEWQRKAIAFVAAHRTGFATPQHDGSVFIYSPAVDRDGRWHTLRSRAKTTSEVRAILGY